MMLIGHNPGLEDVIFDLVPDDGSSPLRDIVEEKFPTASYAVMEIDIDNWAELEDGSARLVHLIRPRDLDAELGPQLVD
jgi:phosphohistidine phosphatase